MCVCAPFCLNLYGTRSVSLLGYVFLPKRDSIPRPLDLTIGECFSLTEVQTESPKALSVFSKRIYDLAHFGFPNSTFHPLRGRICPLHPIAVCYPRHFLWVKRIICCWRCSLSLVTSTVGYPLVNIQKTMENHNF